jgi:hypothetical protein
MDGWLPDGVFWPESGEVAAVDTVAGAVKPVVAASPTRMIAPLTDVSIFFTREPFGRQNKRGVLRAI